MPELLLHYIWQNRAFIGFPQKTTDGRQVEVIDVGLHNSDAGPDFFNAKLRIDGMLWVGNIEIHVVASDWYKHGHDKDAAYDNVILHVVRKADREVVNSQGKQIPQCELQYPHDEEKLEKLLVDRFLLCSDLLPKKLDLLTEDWRHALLCDRMRCKTEAIGQLLRLTNNNWEEAFYITLAHNFGFHTNGLPFEMLAKSLPLSFILKHRDNLFQLEALLFGQSGLLTETTATDEYSQSLLREYKFLQKKFLLSPCDGSLWKLLRMRPQNFPHRRIAQFAALLHESEFLFSKVINENDVDILRKFFMVSPSEYWTTHYRFSSSAIANNSAAKATIGKQTTDLLLINSVVPYQYAYAKSRGDLGGQDAAFQLLSAIPAEHNNIIERWKMIGFKIRTAAESQTFIHLYQNYCILNRCMKCDVGWQIFGVMSDE